MLIFVIIQTSNIIINMMRPSLSEKPTYQQQGLLGKGSFAQVYKVSINSQYYALKRIYTYHLKDPNYYKSIKRQIAIMQKLDHSNIVKLIDVYESQNSLELLLEYIPGGNLYDKIKCQDRVPEYLVKNYMLDIVKAIKYLHSFPQPILHRDIKPQNILLTEKGGVKLCDFGSANMIIPKQSRQSYVGTAQYMAPQMKQCKPHDQSLDLWCIGVLIYELLTGCVPDPQKQIEFPDYISRPVEDLIKRILVKQQNKRITIEQIEDHIWFTGTQIVPQITQFTLGIKRLETLGIAERIKQKNKEVLEKLNKKQRSQKEILQMQCPALLTNSSFMTKIAQQNANVYMKDLRDMAQLHHEIKSNQNKISTQRNNNTQLKEKQRKQIEVIKEKIKELQQKNTQLKEKQSKTEEKCLSKLKDLFLKLSKIEQYASTLPAFYQSKILTFEDIKIEPIIFPVSQYLPKLKLKMLQQRRDALIELKCIRKRRKQMEVMLAGVFPEEQKYQYDVNATTQQMLFKDKL